MLDFLATVDDVPESISAAAADSALIVADVR
jgi:hypothetical protein